MVPRGLRCGVLRGGKGGTEVSRLALPLHGTFRGGRSPLLVGRRPAQGGRGRRLDGDPRERHGPPQGARGGRDRPGSVAGLCLRDRHRPPRDAEIRDPRPQGPSSTAIFAGSAITAFPPSTCPRSTVDFRASPEKGSLPRGTSGDVESRARERDALMGMPPRQGRGVGRSFGRSVAAGAARVFSVVISRQPAMSPVQVKKTSRILVSWGDRSAPVPRQAGSPRSGQTCAICPGSRISSKTAPGLAWLAFRPAPRPAAPTTHRDSQIGLNTPYRITPLAYTQLVTVTVLAGKTGGFRANFQKLLRDLGAVRLSAHGIEARGV